MLYIILSCIGLVFIWIGAGLFFSRASRLEQVNFEALMRSFWIGWAMIIAFLQVWHLFFPVNGAAFFVILAASLLGWLRARKIVLPQLKIWGWGRIALAGGLAMIPLVILSSHVMFASPAYDHGLYHLQVVSWLNQYAIVPGLGNLHHRLAFNNSNLLYAALINWGPFVDRAYYLATTMPAFMLILTGANGLFQAFRPAKRPSIAHLFYAWMLPIMLWQFNRVFFAGYSTDAMIFILQVVAAGVFLSLVESEDKAQAFGRLKFLTLIACVSVTVKLSFAIFGLSLLLAALLSIRLRFGWGGKQDWQPLLTCSALASLFLLPWVARNGILSGYLLFPSTVLSLPFSWRIPYAMTAPIAPGITEWARTVSNTFTYSGDLAWFRQWWQLFPHTAVQRALFMSAALWIFNFGWMVAFRKKVKLHLGSILLFSASLLSSVYWLWLAPDYRFSGAALWLLLISTALFAAHMLIESAKVQATLLTSAVLLGLTLWLNPNQFYIQRPEAGQIIYPLGESELLEKRYQPAAFPTRHTLSGLEVHTSGESSDQCWYADLPCTRSQDFLPGLHLIDPRDMQKGFMVDP
ncbi:MAG: hypothetical protein JW987_00330 [Anaerolineaceae bacterium]|nr:hypothetical protein [Anaerolineaceae bacterium]